MRAETRLSDLLETALGPGVRALLRDPEISEIRLNADGTLWASKLGKGKYFTEISVSSENARQVIYAVAYSVNEICNEQKPAIGAELPGTGERFQGVLPPLSKAPAFSIRKRAVKIFSLEELVTQGVIGASDGAFLKEAVLKKENILIVGGTDSGKTTFANALLKIVGTTTDRIVIIEDTQELQCEARDIEYLRTKDGVASLRDLVRMTMRLSPDRIVIGEVRGAEALDLLKAWNTGHGGGVSTVHASSAKQGLSRIEQLVQEANVAVPSKQMIADAVNVLIYMEKVGPKRLVKDIMRVTGIRDNAYELAPIS